MIARLKSAMNRLAGIEPPDPGRAEGEIRAFVLALQRLALSTGVLRDTGEARR